MRFNGNLSVPTTYLWWDCDQGFVMAYPIPWLCCLWATVQIIRRSAWGHCPFSPKHQLPGWCLQMLLGYFHIIFFSHDALYFVECTSPSCSQTAPEHDTTNHPCFTVRTVFWASSVFLQIYCLSSWLNSSPESAIFVPMFSCSLPFFYDSSEVMASPLLIIIFSLCKSTGSFGNDLISPLIGSTKSSFKAITIVFPAWHCVGINLYGPEALSLMAINESSISPY